MKSKRVFVSVFYRSFFLQTLWNFEGMQNVGFAYGILPILRRIYPDPEARKKALLRHIGFFNTHPYMVNMIFGLVAAMEEEASKDPSKDPEEIVKTKNNIAGPLAAIGDSFFWATWRPFSVILTIALILLLWDQHSIRGTLAPPLFFIGVYNMVALPFCYWSLLMSFRLQNKVIGLIAGIDFQRSVDLLRTMGKLIITAAFILYVARFSGGFMMGAVLAAAFGAGCLLGCVRVSPVLVFFLTLLACGALAYAGII